MVSCITVLPFGKCVAKLVGTIHCKQAWNIQASASLADPVVFIVRLESEGTRVLLSFTLSLLPKRNAYSVGEQHHFVLLQLVTQILQTTSADR